MTMCHRVGKWKLAIDSISTPYRLHRFEGCTARGDFSRWSEIYDATTLKKKSVWCGFMILWANNTHWLVWAHGRMNQLAGSGALGLGKLRLIVLDMQKSAKGLTLLDVPELRWARWPHVMTMTCFQGHVMRFFGADGDEGYESSFTLSVKLIKKEVKNNNKKCLYWSGLIARNV